MVGDTTGRVVSEGTDDDRTGGEVSKGTGGTSEIEIL